MQRNPRIRIDSLEFLTGKGGTDSSSDVEIIVRSLSLLAREIDAPIVVSTMLNRDVEGREDKRPQFTDLCSSVIRRHADVLLFLYRNAVYEGICDGLDFGEISVAKNRFGDLGTVRLRFIAGRQAFADL